MLARIEIFVLAESDNDTKKHVFGTMFSVRNIPSRLASKVNSEPGSLRVFPTANSAKDNAFDGESLQDVCDCIFSNKLDAEQSLKFGGFSFNGDDDSTVVMYLRIENDEVKNRHKRMAYKSADASVSNYEDGNERESHIK